MFSTNYYMLFYLAHYYNSSVGHFIHRPDLHDSDLAFSHLFRRPLNFSRLSQPTPYIDPSDINQI